MKALQIAVIVTILAVSASPSLGQVQIQPNQEEMQRRLADLEAKFKALSEELTAMRALVSSSTGPVGDRLAAAQPKPVSKPETDAVKAAEPAKKKDLGVDVGSARLTPYGTIYFNAFGNSGGTNNSDVPLWATTIGNSNFSASARQTRLGLKLEGTKVGNARLAAAVEADFFGGFPAVGIGENFGVVRLRLANARLDWEKTSVTVGQDWMLFAPQNPTSIAAAAIPQLASAGNNWARLPQAKIERKLGTHVLWQAAVLAPQTGDSAAAAGFFLQPTSGASSRIPFFQSRLAFSEKNWFGSGKSGTIAVSGHYGQSRVFTGTANVANDIDSAGAALDWNFPLSKRVSLVGEAFFGRNLGGFQAGVFQSYNTDFAYRLGTTLVSGGVRSIGTRGGWTQIGITPNILNDRLVLYASIGIDDPKNDDLVSLSLREWRTRNLAYAFNAIYKFTPQFSIGFEARSLQTNYFFSGRRNVTHTNLGATYTF